MAETVFLITLIINILLSVFLIKGAKNEKLPIAKKTYILMAGAIVIMILAMILRLPAPY